MISRKLFSDILEKTLVAENTPLLIYGARGTGKTTAIQTLLKTRKPALYFNLEEASDRASFNLKISPEDQLDALFFLRDKKTARTDYHILLDEVQALPDFSEHLQRLFRTAPGISWIMTSSRLSQEIKNLMHLPGLPVTGMPVFPCSFHDFLMTVNDSDALESYQEIPFPGYRHEKLLRYFHIYTLIGGMPGVLNQYSETKSLSGLNSIYEKISAAHLMDIESIKSGTERKKMSRFVLQNAYPYAATRIKFNGFGNSSYKSREIGNVFRLLETHMVLHLIYPQSEFEPPSSQYTGKLPRLHLLDTGMVNYFSGIQKPLFHSDDMNRIFHGQIARQVVGQELMARASTSPVPLRFWVRAKAQSRAEVDFILPYHDLFIPVEVRSGGPGRLRSLHQFMDVVPHPFAVRLYAGKLAIQQTQTLRGKKYYLLSLPYFLAGRIKEHLEGFIKFVSF